MKRVTKEVLLSQLQQTSNQIASDIDRDYFDDIDNIVTSLAISYDILISIINHEDQTKISNADFQSALLYFTALNTILGTLELFRRGYSKEPQMLFRNAIETMSAAYDIHANPEKYTILMTTPDKFDSKKSISVAKSVHSFIGQMYGLFSSNFSHVSPFHILPHKSRGAELCIGGLYDKNEKTHRLFTLSQFIAISDVLGSLLELTFYEELSIHRYWTYKEGGSFHYKPNLDSGGLQMADRLKEELDKKRVSV